MNTRPEEYVDIFIPLKNIFYVVSGQFQKFQNNYFQVAFAIKRLLLLPSICLFDGVEINFSLNSLLQVSSATP